MKTQLFLLSGILLLTACESPTPWAEQTARSEEYSNQEPYSKTRFERIDEPAGASSQTENGVNNPFIEPKDRDEEGQRSLVPPPE